MGVDDMIQGNWVGNSFEVRLSELKESLRLANRPWNDYEIRAIESISHQFDIGVKLSPKQLKLIDELYERL
jgi:hypothetical protein